MTQPNKVTATLRRGRRHLARSPLGQWRSKVTAGRPTRTILIASDGQSYTSEQQFAPLMRFAPQIARKFGLVFEFSPLQKANVIPVEQLSRYAAIGLKFDFKTSTQDALSIATHFFEPLKETNTKALVFDGDDDQSVLWSDLISLCDCYIKKHTFSDPQKYAQPHIGKSNLTDYVHRTHGVSFEDDIIPTSEGLPQTSISKIILGWNISLDDKIFDLSSDIPVANAASKDIDVLCRASVPEDWWTFPMRNAAVRAISGVKDHYKVHAPTNRVPPEEYYNEMRRSRISVSPFGFGELCWRDFESILSGALLIKPDMSHLTTAPDLFVPGETYAPVAWDYANLGEVCGRYLDDEPLRRKIADQAREKLLYAMSEEWFLDRFEDVMGRAGIPT